ncbi:MAG: hypothetical protein EH225_04280 [Calditrichaeota bacterium]|nr:hypothetical protein [Calditrichota bacterium]RQW05802.1 MAG: hypothetical protein EH225_04280 [Calditrichota bacterium]
METNKGGMVRHLQKCAKINDILERSNDQKSSKKVYYHLGVEDAYSKIFWFNLEMAGSETLEYLDAYLRAIWLECCDHLSEFNVGGWGGKTLDMETKVGVIFKPGLEITHFYDFGTTSETKVKILDSRIGKPLSKHPLTLLARNIAPEYKCVNCGKKARWLCMECLRENNTWETFCDECVEKHTNKEYGEAIPLVNSPRLGMCGYTGPAVPPY